MLSNRYASDAKGKASREEQMESGDLSVLSLRSKSLAMRERQTAPYSDAFSTVLSVQQMGDVGSEIGRGLFRGWKCTDGGKVIRLPIPKLREKQPYEKGKYENSCAFSSLYGRAFVRA